MIRWAWTGSREHRDQSFTRSMGIRVAADVAMTVISGDEIAQGGCSGVDAVVLQTALWLRDILVNIRVVTFTAEAESTWHLLSASPLLIDQSDEVVRLKNGKPMTYLERDRELVSWARYVRAMPIRQFKYDSDGSIIMQRGSGTNYTARLAQKHSKLTASIPLTGSDALYTPGFDPSIMRFIKR